MGIHYYFPNNTCCGGLDGFKVTGGEIPNKGDVIDIDVHVDGRHIVFKGKVVSVERTLRDTAEYASIYLE